MNSRSRPYTIIDTETDSARVSCLLTMKRWSIIGDCCGGGARATNSSDSNWFEVEATVKERKENEKKKRKRKNVFTTIQSKTGQKEKRKREMGSTKKSWLLFFSFTLTQVRGKKPCSFQSGKLFLCAYTGVVTADTKAVAARVKRLVLTTR